MKQLLGENKLEDRILRQLFLQRLPQNVHLILASSSDTVDLEQLAVIADKIIEVAPPPTVAACSNTPSPQYARIGELQAQVNQLTNLVQGLVTSGQQSRRSRSRNRSTSRKDTEAHLQSKDVPRAGSECWYHWRFGDKATKCVKPCSYCVLSLWSDSSRPPNEGN